MDANNVQPFFDAASSIMDQMFNLKSKAENPHEVIETESHEWEVSGIIGIAGNAQGVVAIRFPQLLVDEMLRITGVSSSSESDRRATASGLVAEMTNIICGNALGSYSNQELEISPPVVVKGQNHQITWPKIASVLGCRFTTEKGPYELDICFNGKR